MKLRLSILLLAAALAASPAAGQTIKSLGYNTTNGNIVAATNVTFTNSVGFATNAQAATRTNLGGTTVGDSVFTATNAAAAATAVGLGTTNSVTFQSLTAEQLQVRVGTNLYVGLADDVSEFWTDVAVNGELSVNDLATFSTNVTVNGNATLNGVDNLAPSQTASSGASLMTRDLGDARYGPTLLAYKTSNTSRASTTNVEADPHLTFSNVPVGIYEVTLTVQVYDNSNHGIIWNIGGTATASSIGRALAIGDLYVAGNVLGAISGGILTGQSVAPWGNSTRVARYYGLVNVTAAGSLSLQWAQNTSNTNALQVIAGSRMTLVKFP